MDESIRGSSSGKNQASERATRRGSSTEPAALQLLYRQAGRERGIKGALRGGSDEGEGWGARRGGRMREERDEWREV